MFSLVEKCGKEILTSFGRREPLGIIVGGTSIFEDPEAEAVPLRFASQISGKQGRKPGVLCGEEMVSVM